MTQSASDIALTVNGRERTVAHGTTVADLLESLGLRRDGVAVAVNMAVVPRSRHADRTLQAGERVEVVQAVGGG